MGGKSCLDRNLSLLGRVSMGPESTTKGRRALTMRLLMETKGADMGLAGGIPESRYQNVNIAEELLLRQLHATDGQDKAHTAQQRLANQMNRSSAGQL